MPWWQNPMTGATREGKYGEIMPEDEFIGMIKMSDSFDLVYWKKAFMLKSVPN
jgi:hypothetical protein